MQMIAFLVRNPIFIRGIRTANSWLKLPPKFSASPGNNFGATVTHGRNSGVGFFVNFFVCRQKVRSIFL